MMEQERAGVAYAVQVPHGDDVWLTRWGWFDGLSGIERATAYLEHALEEGWPKARIVKRTVVLEVVNDTGD